MIEGDGAKGKLLLKSGEISLKHKERDIYLVSKPFLLISLGKWCSKVTVQVSVALQKAAPFRTDDLLEQLLGHGPCSSCALSGKQHHCGTEALEHLTSISACLKQLLVTMQRPGRVSPIGDSMRWAWQGSC